MGEAPLGTGAVGQSSLLDQRLNRGFRRRDSGFGAGEGDGRHGQKYGHGDVAKKATVEHFKFQFTFTIGGSDDDRT